MRMGRIIQTVLFDPLLQVLLKGLPKVGMGTVASDTN
jgi:hypothetical protein